MEIHRGHGDARGKLRLRHVNIRLVPVQQVQLIADPALLFAILKSDRDVIGFGAAHGKGDGIIVGHSLDNAVKVVGIETDIQLGRRVIVLVVLELGGLEAHMSEDGARIVHGNHPDSVLVKDQTHLH